MEIKKDITYLGKDFGQFRKNLIDFTKQCFPNEYKDFNETSPGMLFMEMASYVGDVLSYYTGYKAKNVIPAVTVLDVFQLVPAIGTGVNNRPDYTFALSVKSGLRAKQNNGPTSFRTLVDIDFSFSSSFNPTEVTVYESDADTKQPTYYLLKKQAPAVSGTVRTIDFSFGTPKPYDKVVITDKNGTNDARVSISERPLKIINIETKNSCFFLL